MPETAREIADGIMDDLIHKGWREDGPPVGPLDWRDFPLDVKVRDAIEAAILAAERRGLEALTAPVEGMEVQEALDYLRAGTEAYGSYPGDIATVYDETNVRIAALIERLSSALAAERAEKERLAGALTEIACFDDEAGNRRLAAVGSYGLFDEPGSVSIARAALSDRARSVRQWAEKIGSST